MVEMGLNSSLCRSLKTHFIFHYSTKFRHKGMLFFFFFQMIVLNHIHGCLVLSGRQMSLLDQHASGHNCEVRPKNLELMS